VAGGDDTTRPRRHARADFCICSLGKMAELKVKKNFLKFARAVEQNRDLLFLFIFLITLPPSLSGSLKTLKKPNLHSPSELFSYEKIHY
jgi:hypothetical protein